MVTSPKQTEWSDALSMSNAEIDAQHQYFIALTNELNDAIIGRHEKNEIERIINLMLEDALTHFAHEEQLFIKMNYPRTEEHKRHHAELIKALQQVLKKIRPSVFSQDWVELVLATKSKLIEHVLNEDTQYINYLRIK